MAFQLAFGWATEVNWTPQPYQSYSERSKVHKFVARWSHSEAETRVAPISIDLLVVRSWRHPVLTSCAWGSGQGFIFTYSKFGGSEFESRQSHTLKIWTYFSFLAFLPFFLLHVSLYSHRWSSKTSRGFCDNVFLIKGVLRCENSHRR